MKIEAVNFRESCIEILKFLADPEGQRKFSSKVEYDDYKSEFIAWWFDDLAFETLPDGTDLIHKSFSQDELIALQKFTSFLNEHANSKTQTMEQLLGDTCWLNIIKEAAAALKNIDSKVT